MTDARPALALRILVRITGGAGQTTAAMSTCATRRRRARRRRARQRARRAAFVSGVVDDVRFLGEAAARGAAAGAGARLPPRDADRFAAALDRLYPVLCDRCKGLVDIDWPARQAAHTAFMRAHRDEPSGAWALRPLAEHAAALVAAHEGGADLDALTEGLANVDMYALVAYEHLVRVPYGLDPTYRNYGPRRTGPALTARQAVDRIGTAFSWHCAHETELALRLGG